MDAQKENRTPCLILDDAQVILSSFQAQFKMIPELSHFRLVPCINTDQAFEALLVENIQLILLDLNLRDDMSGMDFLKRLKSTEAWRAIPVIMVSVDSRKNKIIEAINLGANDFLTKPLDRVSLISKIQAVFNGREKIIKPV